MRIHTKRDALPENPYKLKCHETPVSAQVFHTLDLKKSPEMGVLNCEKVGV